MAAWTHSFVSPQGERKACSISDKVIGVNTTLDEMWNGEDMKNIRKKMLNGETLEMCGRCDINVSTPVGTYRDFFNNTYQHLINDVKLKTNEDGLYEGLPINLSYMSNTCNFKCKMCWEGSSSQIQAEKIKNGIEINVLNQDERNRSMEIIKNELYDENIYKNITDLAWAGGEPLYWDVHWDMLGLLIRNDLAKNVSLMYNTNLSVVEYNGSSIYEYFKHFKKVDFGCSLDGTSNIGEWVRSNLNYNKWREHFSKMIDLRNNTNNIKVFLWITVTTPTIFDFENLHELCKEFNVVPTISSCYTGEPFNLLTPRAFPKEMVRDVFNKFLNNHLNDSGEIIMAFKNYINFFLEQNFHENDASYIEVFKSGIEKIKYLEENRPHSDITFEGILKQHQPMYDFYKGIL